MSDESDALKDFRTLAIELVERSFFSPDEKRVLTTILEASIPEAGHMAGCRLSPEAIAEKSGLSVEQVWDAMSLFEDLGVLQIGNQWKTLQ